MELSSTLMILHVESTPIIYHNLNKAISFACMELASYISAPDLLFQFFHSQSISSSITSTQTSVGKPSASTPEADFFLILISVSK